jgi:hypothetical protein
VFSSPREPVQALWQVIGDLHQAAWDTQHHQRLEQALAALVAPAPAGVTIWAVGATSDPLVLRPWLGADHAPARALALQAAATRQTTTADCPHILAAPLIAWSEVQGVLTLHTMQQAPALLAARHALEHCAPFLATLLRPPTAAGQDFLRAHLEHELMRARRLQRPLAVLLIRHVPPAWAVEDAAARPDVASEIGRICRRMDIAGHDDAGRCLLILPETTCRQARHAAERFRARLRRAAIWPGYREGRWDIGIAGFPVDGRTASELITSAESALTETQWPDEQWNGAV